MMGRNKGAMQRIENHTTRQATYIKRKEGILKKAKELSILCGTDIGLVMFSPAGHLTAFPTNQRVEDIFLRFVDRPDELRGGPLNNEEYLSTKLKQIKREGEMLEKIALIEELQEKLDKLTRQHRESREKMRYYDPHVERINSVLEAGVYHQYLSTAIHRTRLSKAKLLGNQIVPESAELVEDDGRRGESFNHGSGTSQHEFSREALEG